MEFFPFSKRQFIILLCCVKKTYFSLVACSLAKSNINFTAWRYFIQVYFYKAYLCPECAVFCFSSNSLIFDSEISRFFFKEAICMPFLLEWNRRTILDFSSIQNWIIIDHHRVLFLISSSPDFSLKKTHLVACPWC